VLPTKIELQYHENVLLHPDVKAGAVRRDSIIVADSCSCMLGTLSGRIGAHGLRGWEYFLPVRDHRLTALAGATPDGLLALDHIFWWLALGAILLFTPHFPYTKHIHLFMAPLNFLTKPKRTSLGEMDKLDLENADIEQFGVNRLEQLPKLTFWTVSPVSCATVVRMFVRLIPRERTFTLCFRGQ